MRIYSYIFHGLLALAMLGVSLVSWSSGLDLNLDMLPWSPATSGTWLLALGLVGIVSVVLALKGILRVLFLIWSAAVVVLFVKGFFFSPYMFDGTAGLRNAFLFTLAAILALAGAWLAFRCQPKKAR